MKTSSQRQKPDSSQTREHKSDRLTPKSRQTQTPPDPTIDAKNRSTNTDAKDALTKHFSSLREVIKHVPTEEIPKTNGLKIILYLK